MQSMLTGFGKGGRMRTLATGTPWPFAAGVLDLRAIGGKALDQPIHQIARPGMRNVAHYGRDIDHGIVALQHAKLKIVEVQ